MGDFRTFNPMLAARDNIDVPVEDHEVKTRPGYDALTVVSAGIITKGLMEQTLPDGSVIQLGPGDGMSRHITAGDHIHRYVEDGTEGVCLFPFDKTPRWWERTGGLVKNGTTLKIPTTRAAEHWFFLATGDVLFNGARQVGPKMLKLSGGEYDVVAVEDFTYIRMWVPIND